MRYFVTPTVAAKTAQWLFVWSILFLCSCGPGDCDVNETDIRGIAIIPLDNSGSFHKPLAPGTAIPANAFALFLTVSDSVLQTTVGGGACSRKISRRQITDVAVSILPGTSTAAQPLLELTNQLYVQQNNSLPLPLAAFTKTNTPYILNESVIICYGDLPAYGLQRWLLNATLSDGSSLTAITPTLNLTH